MTNLPAYLQTTKRPLLAETIAGNVGAAAPPYVSIMGNRFTLIDAVGDEEPVTTADPKTGMPYLDACIIDAGDHESKIYYAKPFDASAQSWSPPDCWSDNGFAPSRNASLPQSPTCGACPKAVWGSATSRVTNKGIPACSKYQKVALMIAGDEVCFLLRVPPNSLKNLRDYVHKFKGQAFDIRDVVTRVSFDKDTLGTLTFQALNIIDESMCKQREALLNAKATDVLVGRGDMPREGAALAANPTPAAIAAPVAATPLTPTAQPQQVVQQPATAASPSEQPRRRRRSASQPEQAAPAAAAPTTAPFAQPGQPANFGIAQANPPTNEINQMLDTLFK